MVPPERRNVSWRRWDIWGLQKRISAIKVDTVWIGRRNSIWTKHRDMNEYDKEQTLVRFLKIPWKTVVNITWQTQKVFQNPELLYNWEDYNGKSSGHLHSFCSRSMPIMIDEEAKILGCDYCSFTNSSVFKLSIQLSKRGNNCVYLTEPLLEANK